MILRRTYLDKNGDSIFDKEFYENNFVKEKATKEDVEAGLAKKIGDRIEYLTREEVKKFLDSLQDLKLSFIHSDTGKLVDKKGYEEFAKQWANYYKFWGEFGAELSTRRRGANLTKFFEQILWIAPRTTGEGKSFDLIGSSNKKNKTIHFNIDKVKKSLKDIFENHKTLTKGQKKDLLEQFDLIDWKNINPAIIANKIDGKKHFIKKRLRLKY